MIATPYIIFIFMIKDNNMKDLHISFLYFNISWNEKIYNVPPMELINYLFLCVSHFFFFQFKNEWFFFFQFQKWMFSFTLMSIYSFINCNHRNLQYFVMNFTFKVHAFIRLKSFLKIRLRKTSWNLLFMMRTTKGEMRKLLNILEFLR